MTTEINGEPYQIARSAYGWSVLNTTMPTNRFYRSYLVQVGPDGRPTRCSCPFNHHRRLPCKHMAAVAKEIQS